MQRIWTWLTDLLFASAPADEPAPRPVLKMDTPEPWSINELRWA
jgi:hypothetical protein